MVGGGLLGLEAANALRSLGLDTHVVEFADRLMPVQVDEGGGSVLRRRIEDLGVHVHTGMATTEIAGDGQVAAMRFKEGDDLPVDLVVFSAGIRPRDQLARDAGLAVGERGGVVVDDACRTSDPEDLRHRRVCVVQQTASTAWSRPATRWPGSPPTASWAARWPSPAPTCPPSSS